MALIIENGSMVAGAESYVSAQEAVTYCVKRGITAMDLLEPVDIEAKLLLAMDYMTQTYRQRWKGYRNRSEQPCDWPRMGAPLPDSASWFLVPNTTVPKEVKNAQIELALRAIAGDLLGDLERAPILERIGQLQVHYDTNSPEGRRFPAIDRMLAPYLATVSGMVSLERS